MAETYIRIWYLIVSQNGRLLQLFCIPKYPDKAAALTAFLKKKAKWEWTMAAQESFE